MKTRHASNWKELLRAFFKTTFQIGEQRENGEAE
jgi:hypothetical protein